MSLWKFLISGPDYEPRGTAWAHRELFKKAATLIDAGELVKPRVIAKRFNPAKVLIGEFAARQMRNKRRA